MSENVITLLAAFGLGSVVTALVSAWLNSKQQLAERRFEEKKAAYIGLLEAYHKAAVEPSEANSKAFAYWQMRCELVGSTRVIMATNEIVATTDAPEARHQAHEALKSAMRKDLGIVAS